MTACVRCGHNPDEVVTASWSFFVDREMSSLNARIVNTGHSARLYRSERDAWCWEFRAAKLKLKIPKALVRRRVVLTRIYSGRQKERDRDNLIGGAKLAVDALVHEGLIANDDSAMVEISYAQERGPTSGLRVLLESVAA